MSLLERLNFISKFIAQLTTICDPIFKLLKNDAAVKWKNKCQEAFDKIKEYLSNPLVLVPLEPRRHLFLYLKILKNSFEFILEQHDATGKRDQAIYYLSKKFTRYDVKYTLLKRTYCLSRSEAKALPFSLYYIPHLQNRSFEIHLPEVDGD